MTTDPEVAYEAARSAYHDAANRLAEAILATLPARVRAHVPDAVAVMCTGEYGEQMERRLRIDTVVLPDGTETDDIDDLDDDSELADRLDWLTEISGEDYVSADPIRIDLEGAP